MEVTGRLEESGGRFFVNTAGRQRPVARRAFDSARDLVGQEVQGEFTREGVTDLVALAAVVDEIDEAVTRPRAGHGEFFNPYTFIPAPARRTDATAFGDGTPIGHDRYRPDRWTGRIRVQLTTGSPLIISDAGAATWEHDHGIFPTRTRIDGTPIIPASSVKGMIRSAFEAVTVSRFGLFDAKHSRRLAYRQIPRDALALVPARVTDDGTHVEVLSGTSEIGWGGRVPDGSPQYAAWFPAHPHGFTPANLGLAENGQVPPLKLRVRIRLARKPGNRGFDYWQVTDVLELEQGTDMAAPPEPMHTDQVSTGHWVGNATEEVTGWLHWTNRNVRGKHDERVFFTAGQQPVVTPLTGELSETWNAVVASYIDAHREKEITGRAEAIGEPWRHLGDDPGETAWSPHLYEDARQKLTPGALCYARVDTTNNQTTITALQPVMIGRELYEASPRDLAMNAHLTPATGLTQLSAADRVFGWVNAAKGDDQAVRGHVRIGSVEADQATVSEFDGQGVPLAILSGPKPTQARFYAAKNLDGDPLDDRSPKRAGYESDGGLRGRKVYPPHRVADNHWEDPDDVQMPREFQRTGGFRDNQNRSVTSWVDPGSTFHFDMWVDNLTDAELGALLHVVSMPDDTFLRLGGGRPLGFGSVHLSVDWDGSELTGPEQITINDRYRSLSPSSTRVTEEIGNQVDRSFKEALVELVGADGARNVLSSYTASIQGGDGPVHYPRAAATPDPDGKNYEWFTRNEKQENGTVMEGRGRSLPAPYGPLPFHPR